MNSASYQDVLLGIMFCALRKSQVLTVLRIEDTKQTISAFWSHIFQWRETDNELVNG